jgi:hypothetical protein
MRHVFESSYVWMRIDRPLLFSNIILTPRIVITVRIIAIRISSLVFLLSSYLSNIPTSTDLIKFFENHMVEYCLDR